MDFPTVLVLAAGRGERFRQSGGTTHKLDAMLAGVAVLERVLRSVAQSGLPYHVIRPEPAGSENGMGASIARGGKATKDATGWLILPGDLPLITSRSLRLVAGSLASHAVIVPFCNGQQGHPVGFSAACAQELMMLHGEAGAASIVRSYREKDAVRTLSLNDPGIFTNIDTPDDLVRAEAMLSVRLRNQEY